MNNKIIILSGDPNSINSEIIFKSWKKLNINQKNNIFLISNFELLKQQFAKLKYSVKLIKIKNINDKIITNSLKILDIPLDFDTLQPYGCFIGSAAIVVFSRSDSAREVAVNLMSFFEHESCGQCTPCRVGTEKAKALMQNKLWDKNALDDLKTVMVDASICGLGQAAPNPIACVQKYFPHEVS